MADKKVSVVNTPGRGLLVKADAIASHFQSELVSNLSAIKGKDARTPRLVGILSTSAAPSASYAEFTRRQCEELGVDFILRRVGAAVVASEGERGDAKGAEGEGVEEAIIEANEDENVDGIMVYYPIFGIQQDHYLQQIVSPYKDVEGLHFKFHYNLYHNIRFIEPTSLQVSNTTSTGHGTTSEYQPLGTVKSIIPCTPLAVIKCLEHVGVYNTILPYGDRAYGKTISVINRSEVVGRPLAAMLANDGARVFSVDIDSIHEYTKRPSHPAAESTPSASRYHPMHVVHPSSLSLEECLKQSDVVVSAVPNPSYKVKTAALKDGCVCVNVAGEKNFETDVRDKASIYIPTVGKVTVFMLLRNLLRLREYTELSSASSRT